MGLLSVCLNAFRTSMYQCPPQATTLRHTKHIRHNHCKPALEASTRIFFTALYILAWARGGAKPNISTIGADQFDEFDPKERAGKVSFFNWWTFQHLLGHPIANTFLVYDSAQLYEMNKDEYKKKGQFRIQSTNSMRFLNKAAVIEEGGKGALRLCPVTHIEETKQMLETFPPCFPCSSLHHDIPSKHLFHQAGHHTLNRHMGPHFRSLRLASPSFTTPSMLVSIILYDRCFVRLMRAWTGNPKAYPSSRDSESAWFLTQHGHGGRFLMEKKRLSVARERGVVANGGPFRSPSSFCCPSLC
ncbi:hypothetical protein HPP92_028139 [Vanilla planifolia]|uniref:Uncharacterized protein n=1 Tax=Vanilla planifolia TaxID=51239 RepID=A0A835P6F9_VANPL|nr:hypothetical protein HPP92_028139 [Vanilla planifolia]